MSTPREILTSKLDSLPKSPGVYLFKDKTGRVIYVGKAKVLRHRVRSYFQKGEDGRYQYQRLVSAIADLEVIVTDSELEALILEANLIRQYLPRYNVDLRDDKSYPYIKVTAELFPRIFLTRKTPKDGSKYYGPYSDVQELKQLLRTLKGTLKIRNCNRTITPELIAAKKYRPCLNFHIGRCAGACSGLMAAEDYQRNVQHFVNLLHGKDQEVKDQLATQMQLAAEQMRFEEAAQWRDRLKRVETAQWRVGRGFRVQSGSEPIEESNWDALGLALEDEQACAALLQIRTGKLVGRSHFYLNHVFEKTASEVLEAFLKEYYDRTESLPEEIYLPTEIEDAALLAQWLTQRQGSRVRLHTPQQGEKARLVRLAQQNAELLLGELKLQQAKKDFIPHALKALQRDLGLAKIPQRIEAFDVSNVQGKDAVASLVCFVNAKPAKSEYRRFKIKTISGSDDVAMMAEAVKRRYQRVLQEKQPLPDLILVDGGKGQLNRTIETLRALGLENVPAAGLAKRLEEVFLPGCSDSQNLPKNSSSLKLLCQVRDEAHRFAVTYHRKLRQQRALSGELEELPGIGKARQQTLLRHFGSLKRLKEASPEAISEVKGISQKLADGIFTHFHPAD